MMYHHHQHLRRITLTDVAGAGAAPTAASSTIGYKRALPLSSHDHRFLQNSDDGAAASTITSGDDDGLVGQQDTDSGSNGEGGRPQQQQRQHPYGHSDAYEFAAFAAWYIFLLLCCIVPTYCAYRRRARAARSASDRRGGDGAAGGTAIGEAGDWYAEAMAELERRRREDATAAIVGNGGGGSVIGGSINDVVLFRGTSPDGRPITIMAGSGSSPSIAAAAAAAPRFGPSLNSATTAGSSSSSSPVRLVYRRESSNDNGGGDGIGAFTAGLTNFGASLAGANWFFAASQQTERIQREERTRILHKVLKESTMTVKLDDFVATECASGDIVAVNTNIGSVGNGNGGEDNGDKQQQEGTKQESSFNNETPAQIAGDADQETSTSAVLVVPQAAINEDGEAVQSAPRAQAAQDEGGDSSPDATITEQATSADNPQTS